MKKITSYLFCLLLILAALQFSSFQSKLHANLDKGTLYIIKDHPYVYVAEDGILAQKILKDYYLDLETGTFIHQTLLHNCFLVPCLNSTTLPGILEAIEKPGEVFTCEFQHEVLDKTTWFTKQYKVDVFLASFAWDALSNVPLQSMELRADEPLVKVKASMFSEFIIIFFAALVLWAILRNIFTKPTKKKLKMEYTFPLTIYLPAGAKDLLMSTYESDIPCSFKASEHVSVKVVLREEDVREGHDVHRFIVKNDEVGQAFNPRILKDKEAFIAKYFPD